MHGLHAIVPAMRRHWLEHRLAEIGKRKSALATHLGLPSSRIAEIVRGDRTIKTSEVAPLAEFLEMPADQVLALDSGREIATSPLGSQTVRVVGAVEAGIFRPAIEWPEDQQYLVPIYVPTRLERLRKFALEVRGSSMNRLYAPGTILICVRFAEGELELKAGQKVVACRRDAHGDIEATVKELVQESDGSLWLWPRSTDPAHQAPWRLAIDHDHDHGDDQLWIEAVVIASQTIEI